MLYSNASLLFALITSLLAGPDAGTGVHASKKVAFANETPSHVPPLASAKQADANPWTLSTLLDRMAAMKGLSAKFHEEKHMSLLAVPLVNEGSLHFARGVGLVRHTQAPAASTVLIRGDKLSVGTGTERRDIDLGQNPVVRLFVDSILKIYAGDRPALERMYTMQFTPGEADQWAMTLVPKLAPMDKIIARVELKGHGLALTTMNIVEHSGDETVTRFSEVQLDRTFSEAEVAQLFRLPG